jgi:hypothetical protein
MMVSSLSSMVLNATSIVSGVALKSTEEEFALHAAVEGLSRELSEQTMLAKVPSEEIRGNQDGAKCASTQKCNGPG